MGVHERRLPSPRLANEIVPLAEFTAPTGAGAGTAARECGGIGAATAGYCEATNSALTVLAASTSLGRKWTMTTPPFYRTFTAAFLKVTITVNVAFAATRTGSDVSLPRHRRQRLEMLWPLMARLARTSEDPLTVGASARVITRTLMRRSPRGSGSHR